jgi:hypothetical protein
MFTVYAPTTTRPPSTIVWFGVPTIFTFASTASSGSVYVPGAIEMVAGLVAGGLASCAQLSAAAIFPKVPVG